MRSYPRWIVISFFILLASGQIVAQKFSIRGRVIDGETQLPLDSVEIYCFGKGYMKYSAQITDSHGNFSFDELPNGRYSLHVYRDDYKDATYIARIKDSSVTLDITIYSVRSRTQPYKNDIAEEDIYHGAFAILFSSVKDDVAKKTIKGQLSFEWTYSFKRKLTRFDQAGIELTPIKLYWCPLKNDTIITKEVYDKEKYFAYYISIFAYNRLFLTKQKKTGNPGFFLDTGIGYELPAIFEYRYNDGSGHKGKQTGIHNYKEVSGLLRLGFDVFSIKATYRFFDILKNDFPQPPRLRIGIEFNFPERYM
jgi:hypothetical protein